MKSHLCFASPNNLLRPSTTNKKSNRESRQLCLRILCTWMKVDVEPLISTAKNIDVMQLMTQVMKGTSNPR